MKQSPPKESPLKQSLLKQSPLRQCPLGFPLSHYFIVPLISSLFLFGGCSKEAPATDKNATQASSAASSVALDITRITPEEAKLIPSTNIGHLRN